MPKNSFAETMIQWELLLAGIDANAADLPTLEPQRAELLAALQEAKTIDVRQASRRAELNQATRDAETVMARGRDVATRLRAGVRARYGTKGEKLTEFGLKPLRRRPRPSKPAEPEQPPDDPAEPSAA